MKKIYLFLAIILALPTSVNALVPNDPDLSKKWPYEDIKAFEAWEKSTGSKEVVVAIVDNGFDTFHPDIFPNAWKNEDEIPDNNIDDDNNGYIDDVWGWDFSGKDENGNGLFEPEELKGDNDPRPRVTIQSAVEDSIHHGTLVAGIVGAVGNNLNSGAGVNWQVRLMNVKALEQAGVGDLKPLSYAIRYAVDNGADVINISLVGDVDDGVRDSIKYAYDNGVVVVAASGNNRLALNISPVYPICADSYVDKQWVLGVSAIGEDHYLAPFSNVGSNCIDITAPGVNIASTMRYAPRYGLTEKYGGGWKGTSFAAPFVAGTAALVKSIQPSWGPDQIYSAILDNVHRTPPADVEAYENFYGAGLLQINKVVDFALSQISNTKTLHSINITDLNTGEIINKKYSKNLTKNQSSILKNIDDVAATKDGYVTIEQTNKDTAKVSFYNKDWAFRNSWTIESFGKQNFSVGNVYGDEAEEIIVSPDYASDIVYSVYSLSGEKLDENKISQRHGGVNSSVYNIIGGLDQVLAVYKLNSVVSLYHFDAEKNIKFKKDLDFVKNRALIESGDINGDGIDEYVLAAAKGETPYLVFYNENGRLLRKFFSYGTTYTRGVDLLVGDYNMDGSDDIVVAPKTGDQDIRVWNRKAKKLETIKFSGNNLKVFAN